MASTTEDMSPSGLRELAAMNARVYAMTEARRDQWYREHPLSDYVLGQSDPDAAVLRSAAEVLKRRFGVLTAGDLIQGLRNAAYTIEESR